jgi:hypothetical protein
VLLGVLALVLVSVGYAVVMGSGSGGALDPASYAPGGARAVATLAGDRGVRVQVIGDVPALLDVVTPRSTVLVPTPGALTQDELAELGALDTPLVVLGAGSVELEALGLDVTSDAADLEERPPGCALPAAVAAGSALTGSASYRAEPGVASTGCYLEGGRATVLSLPGERTTLVGAPDPFTNDRLGDDGNAALALGLLGDVEQVLWLQPDPGRAVPGEPRSVRELLPDGLRLGALQLVLAVLLLALWRARRLGRVVVEPLPVVVRAAEAVEGRGRLYRAAGARGAAADALRAGARDRLARRLGLPAEPTRAALVTTLAGRSGRDPREVDALLFGPPPPDDEALVRLADALDGLSA